MANLLRLILLAWCVFSAGTASALIPKIAGVYMYGTLYATPAAACSALIANLRSLAPQRTYTQNWCVSSGVSIAEYGNTGEFLENKTASFTPGPASCPENSNASGTECQCATLYEENPEGTACVKKPKVCEPGYEDDGNGVCVLKKCNPNQTRVNNICVDEPECPQGQTRVNGKCEPKKCPKGDFAGEYKFKSASPAAFCEGGCQVSVTTFVTAIKDGKVVEVVGMGFYTGATCSGPSGPPDPGPGDPGDPDPDPGDPGEGGGGDGGNGGNGGNGGTGGGTGGGNGGSGGNGPGGEGSNDNPPEKCPNGSCTGGDDGKPPEGGSDPSSNGNCPNGTYKANNKCWPKDPPETDPDDDGKCPAGQAKVGTKCVPYQPDEDTDKEKDPSAFGGSCGGFTCKGDAIQCAIAREQHFRNCQLFVDKSPESILYDQEKGKTGNQTLTLEGNETIDLNGRIDSTDAFGGGSGVQDLTVTVAGQTVTLPFSILNSPLAVFGNLLVAVAFLLAFRIVGRG